MNVILVPLTYKGVVLVYNELKKGWEFPGGKIEKNEDAVHAILREIDEEAGLEITNLKFVKPLKNNMIFTAHVVKIRGGSMMAQRFTTLPDNLAYSYEEYRTLIAEAHEKLNADNISSLI